MITERGGGSDDFPIFDWLRIAMALVVTATHFSLISWSNAGNMAVQVFFALSGWLIGGILLEMRRDDIPLFYFNRTTRVWIPYGFSLIILYFASFLKDPITPRWFEFLFYDLTFTHNFFTLLPNFEAAHAAMPLGGTGNHFWSLSVEEQFYLFSPIMIVFFPNAKNPLFWIAIALFSGIFRAEFSAIALGVAAASGQKKFPDFHMTRLSKLIIASIGIMSGLSIIKYGDMYKYIVPIFAVSVVLLAAVPGRRGRVGKFLGGVSYPLYLNHWIALVGISMIAKRFGGNPQMWAIVGMLVALAIGTVAYILIDLPVSARRRKWYSPKVGWVCALGSYSLVGIGLISGLFMRVL